MKYAMTVSLLAVCAVALPPPSSASAQCEYTVGGTAYRDCYDPIGTGEQDVEVCVDCDGGFNACTTTSGGWGGWMIEDVPCGACTVTLEKTGLAFCRVTDECPPDPCVHPMGITVDADHQAENMTLGFWAVDACPNGTCDFGETCNTCPGDCGPCCGNGNVDPGEECDDGNTVRCDGCDATCVIEFCGDGFVCGAEACDDGNNADCDGCRADCSAIETGCGDGFVCGAEVCDDGNNTDCDGCRADCSAVETGCGDGFVCGAEECDDGSTDNCDGCDSECVVEECGNDKTECDEACDGTDSAACPGECLADCTCGGCGNGFCEFGEDACSCPEDCSGLCDKGACCGQDTCTDGKTEDECLASEGRYAGDASVCGGDADGDSVADNCDNCPGDDNPEQEDEDGDQIGDVCDPDIDGDELPNDSDICPTTFAPAGVDSQGRSLGDLDEDCDVDLVDFDIMQENFSGPSG